MTNVVINSTSEVRLYEDKIITQREENSFWWPLVGEVSDANSIVYRPDEMYKNGRYWTVPLAKAVTTAALEDGDTYEGQGQKSIISTTDIEVNERGQVFGGQDTFEEVKTILNLRERHYQEAASWATWDFDYKAYSTVKLALGSLPTKANRAASQYNVEYAGDAQSWDALTQDHKISGRGISRMKKYMQKRGIRPARLPGGKMGYVLIVPTEATYTLRNEDNDYKEALYSVLPRSQDHVLFAGNGFNPWGAWDGVLIVEDLRPVYASGSNDTLLNTEYLTGYMKAQGIFLGAQALAYAAWSRLVWYERIWDHNRKFEISISRMFGFAKPVINLGTLDSATNRDYGVGYYNFTADRVD